MSSGSQALRARASLRADILLSAAGTSKCATIPSACTPVSVRLELCKRGRLGNNLASADSTFSCTPVPIFCTCHPSYAVPSYAIVSLNFSALTESDYPDNFATEWQPPSCQLSLCACRAGRCPE